MNQFFNPKSVAVIGASRDPLKLGYTLFKNLIDYNFKGEVYPINPSGGRILNKKIYKNIRETPKVPELILLSIPNKFVPPLIKDAGEIGVKGAVILSSGFGEMKGSGEELQNYINNIVRHTKIRVIGPNCMGIYNISTNLNGTYFWELPRKSGGISFISQSGAYGGVLFSEIKGRNLGISKFISIGNQIDVTHTDLLAYLGKDNDTKIIALLIEELRNIREFIETAKDIRKPIIAFKIGRTKAGKRATQSHTGSMAGEYEIYKAAFKKAGVIAVNDTDEFFDAISIFSAYPLTMLTRKSLAILTISGGPSVSAADKSEELGIEVPELSSVVKKKLRRLIPPFGSYKNPVDMTPQMKSENFAKCVDIVSRQNSVGAILAINVGLDRKEFAEAFVKSHAKYKKPVVSFVKDVSLISKRFTEVGIPVFPTPERAVKALSKLVEGIKKDIDKPILKTVKPSKVLKLLKTKGDIINEYDAKRILKEYGVKTCKEYPAESKKALDKIAKKLGYPIVLKIMGVSHKSDKGGVLLNITDKNKLGNGWYKLCSRFGKNVKVLVQEMINGEIEIIIGGKYNSNAGYSVIFGLGGIFTEVLRDFSVRLCPVSLKEAKEMIKEIKGYKILKGYRGTTKTNLNAIADIIVKASNLLISNPHIKELDINPVKITEDGLPIAVDALISLKNLL